MGSEPKKLFESRGLTCGADIELLSAIGERCFDAALKHHLWNSVRVEHLAVFRGRDNDLSQMLSISRDGTATAHKQTKRYLARNLWRHDPAMRAAIKAPEQADPVVRLHRLLVADLSHGELREQVYESQHICDRVLMSLVSGTCTLSISVLRTDHIGCFSDDEIAILADMAAPLLAVVDRHLRFATTAVDLSIALRSLVEIQRCVATAPEMLPRRETEVCARILYGISSIGIALELEIGEETVMTYRKRAYQRLGIGSQRELLIWYLRRWSFDRPLAELDGRVAYGTASLPAPALTH